MSVRIEVDVQGDARVAAVFDELDRRGRQRGPLLDAVGRKLAESTRMRFEDQRGPDGRAWTPSVRAREQAGQTLVDTGRLRDSITHRVAGDGVEIGTNVVYAATHQLGADIRAVNAPYLAFKLGDRFVRVREVKIPARPFLGVDQADEDDIVALATDYLEGAWA